MKVSLFVTCLGDLFYVNAAKATCELLERFGCEIDFPETQTCCGQPAYNSGYTEEAKKVAKNTIRTFAHAHYVVVPSGSCAYMLKEYVELFHDDPKWKIAAQQLKEKTYELTEFLTEVLNVYDTGAEYHGTATYHTSCHMTRLLGVTKAPHQLLQNVKGLEMIDLPNRHDCCGFGGTFAVKMSHISEQMVDEKVQHVEETRADVLIGADAGCLMNIGGYITRKGTSVKVVHIAEILNHRG